MKILNLNNKNMNSDVEALLPISQKDFWYRYLQLMKMYDESLTKTEIGFLSELLCYDHMKACFPRGRASVLANKLGIKNSHVSVLKDSLLEKRWLVTEDGAIFINSNLRNFQKFVQENIEKEGNCELMFVLPYKIKGDDK